MDALSDWNRINIIIAGVFLVIHVLIMIPWRLPIKKMRIIGIVTIAAFIPFAFHFYFSMVISTTLVWFGLLGAFVLEVFLCAQYRDGRTLFGLLTSFALNSASTLLAIVATTVTDILALKIIISIAVHCLICLCLHFILRNPFFAVCRLGVRGWGLGWLIALFPTMSIVLLSSIQSPLSNHPESMPEATAISICVIVIYIIIAKLTERIINQKNNEQMFDILTSQAANAEKHLAEASRIEKQSAILRHDLRHFATAISACIRNQHYDEALDSVRGLMSHPAMQEPEACFCKNPTINGLISSYVQSAEDAGITFTPIVSITSDLFIDTMELTVMLSNLLENALNACKTLPEGVARGIELKLTMAGEQLFISISNTFNAPVVIDRLTNLPAADPKKTGHGVGLLSVQAFLQKYNGHADCQQEDGWFRMRIVTSIPKQKQEAPRSAYHKKRSTFKINVAISVLIVGGFMLAAVSSYHTFNSIFRTDVESLSTLTSESIYANINNIMNRPINVSLALAHDTLLMDLMRNEPDNPVVSSDFTKKVQGYLMAYQQKYEFNSVSFISAKTHAYYHFERGILRIVEPDNPEDAWYFKYQNEDMDCKLNIDTDKAKGNKVTIFVDSKLRNTDGTVMGVVGIGIETPYIQQLLQSAEQKSDLQAYLIDELGEIQLSSNITKLAGINLFRDGKYGGMAEAIIENKATSEQKWYSDGRVDGYIITRYIPNLNWYLVVEKNTEQLQKAMSSQLFSSIIFMLIVVSAIVLIVNSILTKFHHVLVGQAERDILTGLRNRSSYEREMQFYGSRLSDYEQFGIGVFDLNDLKTTNDILGHQAGDSYLRDFATLLGETFPHSPAFRIGGDEFLVIFLNMSQAEVEKKGQLLQLSLEQRSKDSAIANSAAYGYAFLNTDAPTTIEEIFAEADRNMYHNKQQQKSKA